MLAIFMAVFLVLSEGLFAAASSRRPSVPSFAIHGKLFQRRSRVHAGASILRGLPRRLKDIETILPKDGGFLLDCCCDHGLLSTYIASSPAFSYSKVIASDLSPTVCEGLIEKLRRKSESNTNATGASIEVVLGNGFLPFLDKGNPHCSSLHSSRNAAVVSGVGVSTMLSITSSLGDCSSGEPGGKANPFDCVVLSPANARLRNVARIFNDRVFRFLYEAEEIAVSKVKGRHYIALRFSRKAKGEPEEPRYLSETDVAAIMKENVRDECRDALNEYLTFNYKWTESDGKFQ